MTRGSTLLAGGVVALLLTASAEAGSLNGLFTFLPNDEENPIVIDLTDEGSVDWAVFGTDPNGTNFAGGNGNIATPAAPDDVKLGGPGAISDASGLLIADDTAGTGFTSVAKFFNDGAGGGEGAPEFSWTDGTNTSTAQEAAALVLRGGKAATEKIVLDVDASTTARTVNLYVSSFRTAITVTASLSDASAPDVTLTDVFLTPTTDDSVGKISFDFAADTPGSTLTLTLTEGDHIVNNFRSFGVAAVALGEFAPIVPGDTSGDGLVTIDDLTPIQDNFRTSVTGRENGDLTGDGVVDFLDYRQWKDNFLSGSSLEAVPEPSAILLATLMGCGSLVRRRHQSK